MPVQFRPWAPNVYINNMMHENDSTSEQYWNNIDSHVENVVKPTGFVLHDSLDSMLPFYYEYIQDEPKEDVENHLKEELEKHHVIGFQDNNDVLHLHIGQKAEIEDLASFLGNVLGSLNGLDPERCESVVLMAFRLAGEIRDMT